MKRIWPGGWRRISRRDTCQWLGTEPEGENWLRGRALIVEMSAVGSGWCCGEVVDMADEDVEVDVPCPAGDVEGKSVVAARNGADCWVRGEQVQGYSAKDGE